MLRVGIIGLGFMGKMHFRCWQALEDARLVAVCDIDEGKFASAGGVVGNITGAEQPLDFRDIQTFTDAREMFAKMNLDAVSITLPTYLHPEYTCLALQSGVNVLSEKPMALDLAGCERMISVARESGKLLQVGHCIRFWPEYARAKAIVDSGQYGAILAATFQRLSSTPGWSWQNWILDGAKSGGAILDMHIHDADFVQYLFGLPESVFCRASKGPSGAYDHAVSSYVYPDGKVITAEGGWVMAPGFGFQMSFHMVLERATIVFDSTRVPSFKVCPVVGETFTPPVDPGDGYSCEIRHFADLLLGKPAPSVLTSQQSFDSVRLILAEKQSADSGCLIRL
jgi:1,5-anhydro-D-fructose reductase (1,5-anhydro-D-mannitol-forming)